MLTFFFYIFYINLPSYSVQNPPQTVNKGKKQQSVNPNWKKNGGKKGNQQSSEISNISDKEVKIQYPESEDEEEHKSLEKDIPKPKPEIIDDDFSEFETFLEKENSDNKNIQSTRIIERKIFLLYYLYIF